MSDSDQKTFSKNFMAVLNKISDSKIKSIDNTQLDKLVSHINLEFGIKNLYLKNFFFIIFCFILCIFFPHRFKTK